MTTKNITVFQSNKFTESRQEFSLNEKRILQLIIGLIKPSDTEFKQYDIAMKDFAGLANIDAKNMYREGKHLMITMLGKFIILEDKENLRMKGFNYFEELDYGDGVLSIKLHKNVHHLFLEIKKNKTSFTAYELTEFMTLTSTYAQRIYELMKQYSRSKKRERILEVTKLREMLGISKDKYTRFADFRKRVLELSKKLIEENTTLRFKWEGITKRGRKIHEIRFYDIHIAGKESPTELQEKAFLENYQGDEIYNETYNTYIIIKQIKKEGDGYVVIDKFNNESYKYKNLQQLQECIAKAITQQGLL